MTNISAANQIQYSLTVLTHDIEENSRKLEASLVRVMGYLESMTGSRDIKFFINEVQAAINSIRAFQIAFTALQAASGPVGWFYAGVSVVAALGSAYAIAAQANSYVYDRGTS